MYYDFETFFLVCKDYYAWYYDKYDLYYDF